MPQVGETRSVGGETRQWDGSRWQEAAPAPQAPMAFDELMRRSDALTNRPSDPADPNPAPSRGQMPPEVAALQDPGPGNYFQEHPNTPIQETTNPLWAMLKSGAGTAGRVAAGYVKSPVKALMGLPGLPGQVAEGLAGQTGLPALAGDPSLLGEAPAALKGLWDYIGANPEAGGDLLGQITLGQMAPAAARALPGAAETGINAVGRGISKTGRGLGAAGEAAISSKVGGFGIPGLGALEAVFGSHPVAGLATAAAPYAAKYGGKLMERGGSALEGLKLTAADNAWASDASAQGGGGFTGPLREPFVGKAWDETPAGFDMPQPEAGLSPEQSATLGAERATRNPPPRTASPSWLDQARAEAARMRQEWAPSGGAFDAEYPMGDEALGRGQFQAPDSSAAPPRPSGYAEELGRAMNARPDPVAAAVFDRMTKEGAFSGQRTQPSIPPVAPKRGPLSLEGLKHREQRRYGSRYRD